MSFEPLPGWAVLRTRGKWRSAWKHLLFRHAVVGHVVALVGAAANILLLDWIGAVCEVYSVI